MLQYLNQNLKYPKEAIDKKIQGKVMVNFEVDKDGVISDIRVIQSVDPILDEEAVRVVKAMGNWNPATLGDKAVRSRYTLPIHFKLNN